MKQPFFAVQEEQTAQKSETISASFSPQEAQIGRLSRILYCASLDLYFVDQIVQQEIHGKKNCIFIRRALV